MSWTLKLLQAKCLERNHEWVKKPSLGHEFHVIELFGEIGEALNCLKKLVRDSVTDKDPLSEELADVIICCAQCAIADDYELPNLALSDAPIFDPRRETKFNLIQYLYTGLGMVLEKNTENGLFYIFSGVLGLAESYKINLMEAVPKKFNTTSEKHGFKTRIEA